MTTRMGQGRLRGAAVVAVAAAAAVSACSAAEPGAGKSSTSTADCAVEVRVDGTVYVESGFAPRPPGRLIGTAELASCADVGRDARGSWFGDDPQQVRAWAVPGHDPREVVAIRAPGGRLRVLVAEDAAPAVRREVRRSLAVG